MFFFISGFFSKSLPLVVSVLQWPEVSIFSLDSIKNQETIRLEVCNTGTKKVCSELKQNINHAVFVSGSELRQHRKRKGSRFPPMLLPKKAKTYMQKVQNGNFAPTTTGIGKTFVKFNCFLFDFRQFFIPN